MSEEQEEQVTLTLTKLLDVYLDGFTTGVASGLLTMTRGACGNEAAENIAQHLVHGLAHDPLSRAEVENEIRERLAGVDSGSKSWWLDTRDTRPPGDQP